MKWAIRACTIALAICLAFSAVAQEKNEKVLSVLARNEKPQFPAEMRALGITGGYAIVAFLIGADGSIEDAVTLEADRRAFGDAVLAVMPAWHFTTDESFPRREVVRFQFSQESVLMSVSYRDALKKQFPDVAEPKQVRTVLRSELSSPPERISWAALPTTIGAGGAAAVSFVIDTEGIVRVPVANSTDSRLAKVVLDAVKRWRFAPVVHEGALVLVEDLRTFTFMPAQ